MNSHLNKLEAGFTSGQLTALEPIDGGKFWLCQCRCGTTTKASKWHLLRHRRKSCGCRKKTPNETPTCRTCKQQKLRSEFYIRTNGRLNQSRCKECAKAKSRKSGKIRHRQLRMAALVAYGGENPECACCGENIKSFLQLDHERGDGNEHRKRLGSENIYKWLKRNHYPRDLGLRVLCANCNAAIASYGSCPHNVIEN